MADTQFSEKVEIGLYFTRTQDWSRDMLSKYLNNLNSFTLTISTALQTCAAESPIPMLSQYKCNLLHPAPPPGLPVTPRLPS